jgi:hypothetical protein
VSARLQRRSSRAATPDPSPARLAHWRAVIEAERASAAPRTFRVWHQGRPDHPLLSLADPPRGPGRYHRTRGRPTWYGSGTRRGAWAELFRHFSAEGVSPFEIRRRIGRADFTIVALDLTQPRLRRALGLTIEELVSDDLSVCQALAALADEAGFDGIHGPSAAVDGERTLAVFGPAIDRTATEVVDSGPQTAPARLAAILPEVHLPPETAGRMRPQYEALAARARRAPRH